MAYIFGSIWDRFNRNGLNALSKSVEEQGKSIIDLVAKGQLTPEQYGELINSVNTNVKFGELSVHDINKNYGKIDQSFLTTELLAQIAGTSPILSVLAKNSVTNDKLSNRSVTHEKTTFLTVGKNLFNKNKVTRGYRLDTSGNFVIDNAHGVSDIVYVGDVRNIISNFTINIVKYNANYEFLSFKGYVAGESIPTDDATYIRWTIRLENLDKLQVERGTENTAYELYKEYLNGVVIRDEDLSESISERLNLVSDSIVYTKNLIDTTKMFEGQTLTTNGNLQSAPGYSVTDYIPVEALDDYVGNYTMTVSQYDEIGNHIVRESHVAGIIFSMRENTSVIRLAVSTSGKDTAQFEKGTQVTSFEPYHEPKIGGAAGMSSPLDGKRVLFIGDSNTHLNNFPNAIANRTGAVTYNGGFGGTRLSDLSQVNTTNNYHKLNGCAIADAIATGDWSALTTAANAIDVAENQNSIPKYRAQLQNIIDACADMSELHAVVLKYGTNDVNSGTFELGAVDSLDPQVWNGAINYFVKTLSESHPHVKIYFCSPVFRLHMPQSTELTGSNKHSDEWAKSVMLPDMAKAMKERANDNHVPFKDLYNESGINKYTAKHYLKPMPADGTHYTIAGDALIADKIEKFLLSH